MTGKFAGYPVGCLGKSLWPIDVAVANFASEHVLALAQECLVVIHARLLCIPGKIAGEAVARASKPAFSGDHNFGKAREAIVRFMRRVLEAPYVLECRDRYWNPDLARPTHFRLARGEVEGVFSNGSRTIKVLVCTTATTTGQKEACVADLNARLSGG